MKNKCLMFFVVAMICVVLSGCQSVKKFFNQDEEKDAGPAVSAQEILSTLDQANNFADRISILQSAYAVEPSDSILQSISAEISKISLTVSPDYEQCEYGESFNLLVAVESEIKEEIGSVTIDVKYADGTPFDKLTTGSDGVFFGEFKCGTEQGCGERQYKLFLTLDAAVATALGDAVPSGELLLVVNKTSVTADIKVSEELYSAALENLFRDFMSEQLDLNLVVPNTCERFHIQMEVFTSEIEHTYQGYSANVSVAFYISDKDGVVIYDLETDSAKAASGTASGVVKNGVEKIFEAIKSDASFKADFQNALFKE